MTTGRMCAHTHAVSMRREGVMPKRSFNMYLDESSIARAERYSERHGTSVSKLVDEFLAHLPEGETGQERSLTPTVERLLGVAKGDIDRDDYRRYLLEKYGS